MDIIAAFFAGWTVIGLIYFILKIYYFEEVYENETKLGRALTIFIGGPITWLIMMAVTKVKFLNKEE